MADDPLDPQGSAIFDREQMRRLYRIITGEEPICPACGEPLGSLIAEREACARKDAYVHAIRFVHMAMANRWPLAMLADVLQACAEATTATGL